MNNSRNWPDVSSARVANLSFALLYPLPFFYNVLTISGSIPQYEISSHIVKMLFFVFTFILIKNFSLIINLSFYFFGVILFIAYASIWTAINSFGAPPGTVWQSGSVIIAWLAIFSVGIFFDESTNFMKVFLRISSLSIISIVLYFRDGVAFVPSLIFDVDEGASYQAFSLWASVTFIVNISTIRNIYIKYIIFLIAVIIVFLLSSRSEMIGFIFAFFVFEAARISSRLRTISLYLIALVILSIVIYYYRDYIINYANRELYLSRQLNIFDLERDNSWFVRGLYADFAWDTIRSSPILGEFGSHYYADRDFPLGAYAHNFTSAWVNYGLIGVSIYLIITIWAFFVSFGFVMRGRTDEYCLSLFVNAFTLVLILVSKPVFWPTVALGWGIFVRAEIRRRMRRRAIRKMRLDGGDHLGEDFSAR